MKRGSTLFLRVAVILIGLPVLALCLLWLPWILKYMAGLNPVLAYLKYPILLGVYLSAISFFFALYQALKLLGYIDENTAFSELSVKALKNIKHCAVAISIIYAAGLPAFFLMAQEDDAPGLVAIGLFITFASLVISVFAAVLQKLLKSAMELKSENDLTV